MGHLSGSILLPSGSTPNLNLRCIPLDSRNNLLYKLGSSFFCVSGNYDYTVNDGYYHFDYQIISGSWVSLGVGFVTGSTVTDIQSIVNLGQILKSPVSLDKLFDVEISNVADGQILIYSGSSWKNTSHYELSCASASYAISSSIADKANYALAAGVSGQANAANFADYASEADIANHATTADSSTTATTALSSSYAATASYIAGYIQTSQTSSMSVLSASYAPQPNLTSYIQANQTSSMSVLSASYAPQQSLANYIQASQTSSMSVASASYIPDASEHIKGRVQLASLSQVYDYTTTTDNVVTAKHLILKQSGSALIFPDYDGVFRGNARGTGSLDFSRSRFSNFSSVTNDGGKAVLALPNGDGYGYNAGDTVIVSGSTAYNGTHTVASVTYSSITLNTSYTTISSGVLYCPAAVSSGNNSVNFGRFGRPSGDNSTHYGKNGKVSGVSGTHFGERGTVSGVYGTHFGSNGIVDGSVGTHFGIGGRVSGNAGLHFGQGGTVAGNYGTHFGYFGVVDTGTNYNTHFGMAGTVSGYYACTHFGMYGQLLYGMDGGSMATHFGVAGTLSAAYTTHFGRYGVLSAPSSIHFGNQGLADKEGQIVIGGGNFSYVGDAQTSILVVKNTTTNNTPTELFLNIGASARVSILTDTTFVYDIDLVARRTDADNESAGWKLTGVIDRNGSTVAMVGDPVIVELAKDSTNWTATVLADNTNKALVIQVRGETAKTIRWVAKINLTEVSG